MSTAYVTRFAPSPTGFLHLGHAYSALTAWESAKQAGGTWLLRLEDLDGARVRPHFEEAIFEDLAWLGLSWPQPVMNQSRRHGAYEAALQKLARLGVIYPCQCSRADIRAALAAPQENHTRDQTRRQTRGVALPFGPLYPGTCRGRSLAARQPSDAIRLNMAHAVELLRGQRISWCETGSVQTGTHCLDLDSFLVEIGDVVLARGDIGAAAYHLSVVVDDAAQEISHVIRGQDLLPATPIHRLLQALLELPVPMWHHHRLIRDGTGKRLAKRDDARAIRTYREAGKTPRDVRKMIGIKTTGD